MASEEPINAVGLPLTLFGAFTEPLQEPLISEQSLLFKSLFIAESIALPFAFALTAMASPITLAAHYAVLKPAHNFIVGQFALIDRLTSFNR